MGQCGGTRLLPVTFFSHHIFSQLSNATGLTISGEIKSNSGLFQKTFSKQSETEIRGSSLTLSK